MNLCVLVLACTCRDAHVSMSTCRSHVTLGLQSKAKCYVMIQQKLGRRNGCCGLGSLVGGPPLLLATLRLLSGSFLRQNFKTVYIFKTRVL